jgi:hypothetical protein
VHVVACRADLKVGLYVWIARAGEFVEADLEVGLRPAGVTQADKVRGHDPPSVDSRVPSPESPVPRAY